MENNKDKISIGLCLLILGTNLTETISINLISPILPFMTEFYLKNGFETTVSEEVISIYSGYLESSFRCMQFISAFLW